MPDAIAEFYSRYPYPGHSPMPRAKMEKFADQVLGCAGISTRDLTGKTVLEAGCGTGEISCSIGMHARHVRGIDVSTPSIEWARKLAAKYSLANVQFEPMDLFDLNKTEQGKAFDLVASFGVLHHTHDPKKGFDILARQVKPNGLLVTGFYHAWGGWKQRTEKFIARVLAGNDVENRIAFMRRFSAKQDTAHEKIFLADRVGNPRERYYRVPEIIEWHEKNGFEVIGIQAHKPKMRVADVKDAGSVLKFELELLLSAKRFFIVAGKKK